MLAVVVVVGGFVAIVATVRWLQGPTAPTSAATRVVPTPKAANTQQPVFWPTGRTQALALEMARQADQQNEAHRAKQAAAREQALVAQRQANQIAMARAAEAQAAADRREAAWNRYYKPSAPCQNPDNRATMDCINEHIRAKREFEKRWQAGEF
ncbi:MAG TPA: hypothetical protein P5163_19610 [Rubrivivax sp.]|nr:hypothetical protein [Burkholderiaceae bacterium]HRZ62799.1 hypothetical protein [Rubrivivax sp.]